MDKQKAVSIDKQEVVGKFNVKLRQVINLSLKIGEVSNDIVSFLVGAEENVMEVTSSGIKEFKPIPGAPGDGWIQLSTKELWRLLQILEQTLVVLEQVRSAGITQKRNSGNEEFKNWILTVSSPTDKERTSDYVHIEEGKDAKSDEYS